MLYKVKAVHVRHPQHPPSSSVLLDATTQKTSVAAATTQSLQSLSYWLDDPGDLAARDLFIIFETSRQALGSLSLLFDM